MLAFANQHRQHTGAAHRGEWDNIVFEAVSKKGKKSKGSGV